MVSIWRILVALAVVFAISPPLLHAQDDTTFELDAAEKEAAETAALAFIQRHETGELGALYDEELIAGFKALAARNVFIEQGRLMRLQLGGTAVARELVGGHSFDKLPTGHTGIYHFVRFRARYPNALVYQDVTLEKVDSEWKIAGFYVLPAPQG